MIRRGSRYRRAKLYSITREVGEGLETRIYLAPPFKDGISAGTRRTIVSFSSAMPIDSISLMASQDEQDWWIIAMVSNLVDPLSLEDGDPIVVPDSAQMRDLTR